MLDLRQEFRKLQNSTATQSSVFVGIHVSAWNSTSSILQVLPVTLTQAIVSLERPILQMEGSRTCSVKADMHRQLFADQLEDIQ